MPSKKIIVVVVLAAALLAGGFFVFQQILESQKRTAYEASSDKIADAFIDAVRKRDVPRVMQDFSSDLLANYSQQYWTDTIFTELTDPVPAPVLRAKGPVQPISPDVPNRYDPQLKQQATQYDYDFPNVNNATYRLSIVIFRQNDAWKINELQGGYLR